MSGLGSQALLKHYGFYIGKTDRENSELWSVGLALMTPNKKTEEKKEDNLKQVRLKAQREKSTEPF